MNTLTRRPATTLTAAYTACETLTRTEAKNFHYGIRLLPPSKRKAMSALYALARAIDDIGDGDLPQAAKTAALNRIRTSLADPSASDDPVLLAVGDVARRFPVPIEAFTEMLDGVQQDVDGTRYNDFAELTEYCRRVAGTVGRLCLGVFGPGADPQAALYADQLGIALQQTNILRDIREDLLRGRVYLPADELDGVRLDLDPCGVLRDPDGALAAVIRHAAERAETWYRLGFRVLPHLEPRSAACCAAMGRIYRHLNHRICTDPSAVYDRRLSLPRTTKTRIAAGTLLTSLTARKRPKTPAHVTMPDSDRRNLTPATGPRPRRGD